MIQGNWYERVQELRLMAEEEPHRAGSEALRILEDWLFESALNLGFRKERAGMREYINFMGRRGRLSKGDSARASRFADIRNCLAHRSGLLMSPALTDELLTFIETLFRSEAIDAEHLMTPDPHCVSEDDLLLEARDWMLEHAVSRLPVVREGQVVGLLTNRDILMLQARQGGSDTDTLTVLDAMSADSLEKIYFLSPRAPYDEVIAHLQRPNLAAIFVTEGGQPYEPLRGVITVSDILPRL